jgi:predicted nuclease with TOPRIM domain
MAFILAALGGVVLGGGLAAWVLSNRWNQQVEEVKAALNELAEKHQEEQQENKELKQELADTRYQLGEAKKDLAAR